MQAASSLGTARRHGWCRMTPPPASTTATAPASRWKANTVSPLRRATSSATRPSNSTHGSAERPLGRARWSLIGTPALYQPILEGTPSPVRAVIGFGANVLLAHADGRRGREALKALDFYAHPDLFMTPTAELADVVLPVA